MLEQHITKGGEMCLIAQMNDDHLRRMIRLILKAVVEIKSKSETADLDPYQTALYGLRSIDVEDAARVNREAIRKLYPYLAEAYLRGIDDLRDELRDAIGRSEALPGGLPSLSAVSVVFDNEDYYIDPDEEVLF